MFEGGGCRSWFELTELFGWEGEVRVVFGGGGG